MTARTTTALGRKHIISAVHRSLRRLGTDYIDLDQVHAFDEATPLEETLSTLDGLVRAGTVRHLGVSNYASWQLQKSVDVARHRGWEPFVASQPLYNLIDRDIEPGLVPVYRNEGAGIIPRSPGHQILTLAGAVAKNSPTARDDLPLVSHVPHPARSLQERLADQRSCLIGGGRPGD